ncbi:MAG: glycosyltransferase family 39 protein [Candidatus Solibacter usitatus]|nr:glycosyltransferase family 39 protein [Candidatus Solibacter usitatus]
MRYLILASLACVVLAGLRAPILSDEVFSIEVARQSWAPMVAALRADVHPPLYYMVLSGWFRVFPADEVFLRVFSALWLGVAAALLWKQVKERAGELAAAAAVAVLMSNAEVLVMAGYGRMYTMLLCATVASMGAADAVRRRPEARGPALGLAAIVAAGLMTHNWFIFVLPALASGGVALLLPLAAGGAVYGAVWGDAAMAQLGGRAQHLAWLKRPGWENLFEVAITHVWILAVVSPLLLALVAVRRRSRERVELGWKGALAAAAVSLALPLAVSQWKPVFNARFTVIIAPWLALALAGVVARAGRAGLALLLGAGCAWAVLDPLLAGPCNSRTAAQVLAEKARPGDTVVFARLSRKPVEWYWRGEGVHRTSFPSSTDGHPGYEGGANAIELRREAEALAREARGRVFVLADPAAEASTILLRALGEARKEAQPACLACTSASKHYFSQLRVFEAGTGTQR